MSSKQTLRQAQAQHKTKANLEAVDGVLDATECRTQVLWVCTGNRICYADLKRKTWLEGMSILCMAESCSSAQVYDSDVGVDKLRSGYMVRGDGYGFGSTTQYRNRAGDCIVSQICSDVVVGLAL